MALEITPVSSRRDRRTFVGLPFRLYRSEPTWIPPLRLERRLHLSRKHNPFFERGDAQLFLARRDGRPVGRISAQVDHLQPDETVGHFGFFECEEDPEAAAGLLAAAEEWVAERGRSWMTGPFDFTMSDECGVLIDGYEHKPLIRQPWQHRYYPALLEGAGMEKAVDVYMWDITLADRTSRLLPILEQLASDLEPKHGITIRHMDKKDFEADMERFAAIYNVAWKDNWGFSPMSGKEVLPKEIKPLLDERWMMIAENRAGETVGAALTFPDWNQVFDAVGNGRLLPFGWVRALRRLKRIDRARVGWLGVLPEYQHAGVAAGFYIRHFEVSEAHPHIKSGDTGWILETNTAMNKAMEAMGGRIIKTYRIFQRRFRPEDSSDSPHRV